MAAKQFNSDEHKRVLTALLIDISKAIGEKTAFKGGTAAMLFYNLPRLSVDLDFDVVTDLTDTDKANVRAALEKHCAIKEEQSKRFTLFYLLSYKHDSPNIKVELNYRVWENNSYKTVWLFGVPIRIADESTMLTNKLVSLTDRKLPVARDVFDCYFFLKNEWPIKEQLIQERTGLSRREYLVSAIDFVQQSFHRKKILAGIGELLSEEQKAWAKEHLVDDLTALLRERMEQHL